MTAPRVFSDTDRCRLGQILSRANCRSGSKWRLIDNLEWELEQAPFVTETLVPEFVVTMYSRVLLRSKNTARELTCTLVYPEEEEMFEQGLSVLSPLGCRLIGRQVGDMIEWDLPFDRGPWQVKEILSQPSHGDDLNG